MPGSKLLSITFAKLQTRSLKAKFIALIQVRG